MNGKSNSVDQREDIIDALRNHPEGLTLRDIAEIVGHHRHTITKYVYELIGAKVIYQREVGAAKLCYLRESYNGDMKKADAEVPRKIGKGQAQLIALMMILLLVPATVIVAQNMTDSNNNLAGMAAALNKTPDGSLGDVAGDAFDNGKSDTPGIDSGSEELDSTHDSIEEYSRQNFTGSNATVPDISEDREPIINETSDETNVTAPPPLPPYFSNDTNLTPPNANVPVMNDTNLTIPNATTPDANETNVTVPNETEQITNETRITIPNVTETDENITENITQEHAEPEIVVDILSPNMITRGEEIELFAVVGNVGEVGVQGIMIEWLLPDFLVLVRGDMDFICDEIAPKFTCTSAITVIADMDASLGLNELKVRVSYAQ
ncbi:MAG: hypothetical protein JXC85_05015 [Candidatus Aenigmarchaeota archaeon]|nr:hypothetical protein [Candidatus Aenigmarchaeota archaeon]